MQAQKGHTYFTIWPRLLLGISDLVRFGN